MGWWREARLYVDYVDKPLYNRLLAQTATETLHSGDVQQHGT